VSEASGGAGVLSFLRGRSFRRIAIAGGVALILGGLGAWVATHRHMVPDAWMAIRSRVPFIAQHVHGGPSSSQGAAPSRGASREMSPAAASLAHAQSQLEGGKVKAAEKTVKPLLRQKLPRGERAFAFRLMGAAEARQGHRRAAVAWFRKSLKVTDDPGERDRLAKRIKQLSRARTREDMSSAGGTP
jgi:predicted negative regulator of RcsB-dependent stress response